MNDKACYKFRQAIASWEAAIMQNKKISRAPRGVREVLRDFPWYKSQNYSPVKDLDFLGWWSELAYRKVILNGDVKKAKIAFEDIKKQPIAPAIRFLPTPDDLPISEISLVEWRRISELHSLPVFSDIVDDWLKKYGECHPAVYAALALFRTETRPLSMHEILLSYSKTEDGVERGPEVPAKWISNTAISVDLRAPDKILIDQFERWLLRKRLQMQEAGVLLAPQLDRKKKGKPFTLNDLSKWTQTRVLEYLDFKICALAGDITFPSATELSSVLFRDYKRRKGMGRLKDHGVDEADVVEAQTSRHAKMLMGAQAIGILKIQGLNSLLAKID